MGDKNVPGRLVPPGCFLAVHIAFDPAAALLRNQREMLERTKTSWLQFGKDHNANYLYYSHLISYRCAIKEALVGYNGAQPAIPLPLPPCNPADPFALPSGSLPYIRVGAQARSASLQITFADGFTSEVLTFDR